jgi:hypothetical protein
MLELTQTFLQTFLNIEEVPENVAWRETVEN